MSNPSARLGTASNLISGATYDILLIDFPDGYPQSILKFNIGNTPRKLTGLQKVAQTFLKVLFTSRGSNVLYPYQGTDFSELTVNANIIYKDTIFISELTSCISNAESQTQSILNTGTDLASQLDYITILGLDTGQESVIMYLKIVTMAGVGAQLSVPFPELNLSLNGAV